MATKKSKSNTSSSNDLTPRSNLPSKNAWASQPPKKPKKKKKSNK